MRTLRTLCAVVVLSLALAAHASAGIISTGVAAPSPTPQATTSDGATASPAPQDGTQAGVADQGSDGAEATASDSVAAVAHNLLQSLLSLF